MEVQQFSFSPLYPAKSLKGQCHEIFYLYFLLLIEPIWAPDKQAKMVCLKIRFRGEIREKFNSAQC